MVISLFIISFIRCDPSGEPAMDCSSSEASLNMYFQRISEDNLASNTSTITEQNSGVGMQFGPSVLAAMGDLSSTDSMKNKAVDVRITRSQTDWKPGSGLVSDTCGVTVSASNAASGSAAVSNIYPMIQITIPLNETRRQVR